MSFEVLVERLRVANKANFSDLCEEAADALERVGAYYDQMQQAYREQKWLEAELTAANKDWRDREMFLTKELATARAEIELRQREIGTYVIENSLLRAALEKVDRKVTKAIDGDNPEIFQGLIEDCQTIARAALTGREE